MTPDKITALSDLPNKVLLSTKLKSPQPRADHPRGCAIPLHGERLPGSDGAPGGCSEHRAAPAQAQSRWGCPGDHIYTSAQREPCSCFQAHLEQVISLAEEAAKHLPLSQNE